MSGRVFILLVLTALGFTGCEKVIPMDLNSADPAVVAEGILSLNEPCTVRLTQTTSYFGDEEPAILESAEVVLRESTGRSETLLYKGNGWYAGKTIKGKENQVYKLQITLGEKSWSAIAKMPAKTRILQLAARENAYSRPGASGKYQLECTFSDTPDVKEYYLVRYFKNGKLLNDYYTLVSDFISENNTISFTSRMNTFDPGDQVEVRVYSVDVNVYNYFSMLDDVLGEGMALSATPYNPVSNFSNGALGYFAAWAYDSMSITLQ